jgi:hypothetical protein
MITPSSTIKCYKVKIILLLVQIKLSGTILWHKYNFFCHIFIMAHLESTESFLVKLSPSKCCLPTFWMPQNYQSLWHASQPLIGKWHHSHFKGMMECCVSRVSLASNRSPKWSFSFRFQLKFCMHFSYPPCMVHLILLDLITLIILCEEYKL